MNFFIKKSVPSAFMIGDASAWSETVTLNAADPAYFAYRLFRDAGYNPNINGTDAVTEPHFAKLAVDVTTGGMKPELNFLHQLGLVVENENEWYISPLSAILYDKDIGIFTTDLGSALSSSYGASNRLTHLRPIMNLFAEFVLPGRIMRAAVAKGMLPDSIDLGTRLVDERNQMEAILYEIRSIF